jgi:hypothetical protein
MWVLVFFAMFVTGEKENPIVAITRPEIGYYISQESCELDRQKQAKAFLSEMPVEPVDLVGRCVKITGPEGKETENGNSSMDSGRG